MSNALNLFPTTTTTQNAHYKLQQLLYQHSLTRASPTQIQTILATSLFDDAVEYLTTLDMNRAASFTFGAHNTHTDLLAGGRGHHGESVAEEMWQLLVDLTLALPTRHSPLALTKTVSLVKYVLLYGSEACVVDSALLYRIETAVRPLRELNTALAEQRVVEQILNDDGGQVKGIDGLEAITSQFAQFGTKATAAMMKLKGGSVDRGHPVREAAGKLYPIVSNPHQLRQLRIELAGAQQSSLVPVGSTKQVGYITDEGRLRLLQEKVAHEEQLQQQQARVERARLQQTRSNLAGKSAVDSFGGGYNSGGGKVVVGAANSLEDMIRAARCELDRHKSRQTAGAAALRKGYTDDPTARERRLAEEGHAVGRDRTFEEKERALQEALEYLEEMQKLEQEEVGDLLEGDPLGDASSSGGGNAGMATVSDGGADLLGFDSTPAPAVADIFGEALAPSAGPGATGGNGGAADFLGFGGLVPPRTDPVTHAMPGYMGGVANSENNAPVAMGEGGLDLRPSLVTSAMGAEGTANDHFNHRPVGMGGGPAASNFTEMESNAFAEMGGAMGGLPHQGAMEEPSEEAQAETSRKMHMAAGLFAGVVSGQSDNASKKEAAPQKRPIMAMWSNSAKTSALDELLPMGGAAAAPALPVSGNGSVFDTNNDLDSAAARPSYDAFGMGPMGLSHTNNIGMGAPPAPAPSMAPPAAPLSDPFGAGLMGGNTCMYPAPAMAPAPSMAPPPPPTAKPPHPPPTPPPPTLPPTAPPAPTAATQSVEQMQEMIKQQQAQMNQMMQMMQQMQSGSGGAAGGWPPSS